MAMTNEEIARVWPASCATAAAAEGWTLFTDTPGVVFIEMIDELDMFTDDEDAWEHVVDMALEGSRLHKQALKVLRDSNPRHLVEILTLHIESAEGCALLEDDDLSLEGV